MSTSINTVCGERRGALDPPGKQRRAGVPQGALPVPQAESTSPVTQQHECLQHQNRTIIPYRYDDVSQTAAADGMCTLIC